MNIKTPVTLDQPEQWPFDLIIRDADGEEVISEHRYAYSSSDRTVADVMACRSHGKQRDEAMAANAAQVAKLEFIVLAVNSLSKH